MTNVLIILAVVLWGLSFVATKICLEVLSPSEIIAARFIMALVVIGFIARVKGLSFGFIRRQWHLLIGLALILTAHLLIQVEGLNATTASNTAWLSSMIPVFIALLSIMFLGERMQLIQILGIIVAVFGVVVLVSRGDLTNLDFIKSYGDWLVLLSCLTWSVYTILGKKTGNNSSLAVTLVVLAISSLIMVPPVILMSGLEVYWRLSLKHVAALLFLGILCMGVAYWLWFEGLKRKPAGRVGAFLYIEPLSTMLAAPVFLGEAITPSLIIGGILVVVGVWLVQYNRQVFLYPKKVKKEAVAGRGGG